MSAHYQVRGTGPGYAGLYMCPLSAGRGRFYTSRSIADDETPSRFSLTDEDGTKLIDFELDNTLR